MGFCGTAGGGRTTCGKESKHAGWVGKLKREKAKNPRAWGTQRSDLRNRTHTNTQTDTQRHTFLAQRIGSSTK